MGPARGTYDKVLIDYNCSTKWRAAGSFLCYNAQLNFMTRAFMTRALRLLIKYGPLSLRAVGVAATVTAAIGLDQTSIEFRVVPPGSGVARSPRQDHLGTR